MKSAAVLLILSLSIPLWAQSPPEPDPLAMRDGRKVETAEQWKERRAEILSLFQEHVYGATPSKVDAKKLSFEAVDSDRNALGGRATRKQVVIKYGSLEMNLLLYLPKQFEHKAGPAFLMLNFYGNQTVHPDKSIRLPSSWVRNNKQFGITENLATEASRGVRVNRWPVEMIIERGYALATLYYGDIDPDFDDNFANGVHALFDPKKQDSERAGNGWGSIGAWAWGLSRALDYLETDGEVDHKRVVVMGHSRLGKTSLWAGAQDQRFAMVISNGSGCGGAALSRRRSGESVARINKVFPHWFCRNFHQYGDNEASLPVDQHLLIALMAPRPVYVGSASKDSWADPLGEFLAARGAHGVYRLLGTEGLPAETQPGVNQRSHGQIGYHLREGKHDVTSWDWKNYLDFADRHLGAKK